MPSYSGVWNLVAVYQAVGAVNWPGQPNPIGLWASGGSNNLIENISITTLGNSTTFGALSVARNAPGACSSTTRSIFAGGNSGGTSQNVIDYVNPSSAGNAADFGDLAIIANSTSQYSQAGLSNSTRGVFYSAFRTSNVIQYLTIATLGNTSYFGDTLQSPGLLGTFASTTRGVCVNGLDNTAVRINVIQYITIATTGNSVDFGDSTTVSYESQGLSNSTRGVYALTNTGGAGSGASNILNYITIATTGNAIDFGDLTQNRLYNNGSGCSSATRGVFSISGNGVSFVNVMEYVTIATTGDAIDFGDLSGSNFFNGCSNSHGGL